MCVERSLVSLSWCRCLHLVHLPWRSQVLVIAQWGTIACTHDLLWISLYNRSIYLDVIVVGTQMNWTFNNRGGNSHYWWCIYKNSISWDREDASSWWFKGTLSCLLWGWYRSRVMYLCLAFEILSQSNCMA